MATPSRHVYGPRALGALVPGVTRAAFRRRAPAAAQLMADWAGVVGPGLAGVSAPRRLSAGTLTLACAGPVALELQHLAGPLMERINTALGGAVVQRLRFTQDLPPAAPTRPAPPPPDARALAALDARLAALPEGPLRAALAALGRRVVAG
ncbi:MAG: DciA family protein [Acetobacteraceae bacterium]